MNPGSRYVQLLKPQRQNLNNGTVYGGLAHALTEGMRGYAARKADEEQKQAAAQREQALTDVLAGMNGGSLTSEGPTQDAAGNARFSNPSRLARMLGDPQTAPFAMRMVEDALKPAPEPDIRQAADGYLYNMRTGKRALPNVQKQEERRDPIKVGNTLVDPVTYQPVFTAPEQQDRFLPISGIGVMDLTTNQLVTPSNQTPPSTSGLNITPPPPVGRGMAPKVAADVAKVDATESIKELGAMREQMKPVMEMAEMASRFSDLMADQDTGGLLRQSEWARNINGAFDREIQEMNAISDQMTPLLRNGFPGAASDSDRRMFRGGAPGAEKDPEVNRSIILGMQAAAQNARDRLAFMEAYVGETNTLRGANEAWQQYLDANPIFDPNGKPTAPKLNEGRMTWREFFTRDAGPKPLTPDEQAELEALRKEFRQ